jgi:hypothetical protein
VISVEMLILLFPRRGSSSITHPLAPWACDVTGHRYPNLRLKFSYIQVHVEGVRQTLYPKRPTGNNKDNEIYEI